MKKESRKKRINEGNRKRTAGSAERSRKSRPKKKRSANRSTLPDRSHKGRKPKQNASLKSKQRFAEKRKKQVRQFFIQIGVSLFVFAALCILLSIFTFKVVKMEGYGMTPLLNDRDRLFVSKLEKVEKFDLICFKDATGELYVRRVIGTPGDRLWYTDNQLFLNEEEQLERYLETPKEENAQYTEDFTLAELTGERQVPKNKYFVLGDNRSYATDSRHFGFVSAKDVVGVVKLRLFPFHTMVSF